jgi:hypothetical protein
MELLGGICYKMYPLAAIGRATGVRAMNTRFLALVGGIAGAVCGNFVHADTLLVQRVQQERGMDVPQRGMSMAQVESRYGAPIDKLAPAGGDAPRHPVINRWIYNRYIVYFERNRVIDAVANRATPTEIGPKDTSGNQ